MVGPFILMMVCIDLAPCDPQRFAHTAYEFGDFMAYEREAVGLNRGATDREVWVCLPKKESGNGH